MARTKQESFWNSKFGSAYVDRNSDFDYDLAQKAWGRMLSSVSLDEIHSAVECGCNIGRNLVSLNKLQPSMELSCIEIIKEAYEIAINRVKTKHSFNGTILESSFTEKFDLSFSCGVLIHINPEELKQNCNKLISMSSKYVLIAEYFNRTPVSIEYHGEKDKLFKRDFGSFILDNFEGLKCIDYGFLWGREYDNAGFDDATYWLFEKVI